MESSRISPLKWRSFSDVAKMSLIDISHHAAWFVRSPLRGACYFRRRIWQVEVAMGGAGKLGGLMITGKGIKMAAAAGGRGLVAGMKAPIYQLSSVQTMRTRTGLYWVSYIRNHTHSFILSFFIHLAHQVQLQWHNYVKQAGIARLKPALTAAHKHTHAHTNIHCYVLYACVLRK